MVRWVITIDGRGESAGRRWLHDPAGFGMQNRPGDGDQKCTITASSFRVGRISAIIMSDAINTSRHGFTAGTVKCHTGLHSLYYSSATDIGWVLGLALQKWSWHHISRGIIEYLMKKMIMSCAGRQVCGVFSMISAISRTSLSSGRTGDDILIL